jgi:hypothetical protein
MSLIPRSIRALGIAAAFAVFGGSGASSLTTTDFYLGGEGGLQSSYSFNVGGIGLTVTAGTFDPSGVYEGVSGVNVGQYGGGLGVTNSVSGDSHLLDGYGSNDILIFTFDRDVRIVSLDFSYNDDDVGGEDQFRFFHEDGGVLESAGAASMIDIPGGDFYASYVFSAEEFGHLFGVGAVHHGDEFLVKKISVYTVVPLPATLLLMLSAFGLLGGVGWTARRTGDVPA